MHDFSQKLLSSLYLSHTSIILIKGIKKPHNTLHMKVLKIQVLQRVATYVFLLFFRIQSKSVSNLTAALLSH